MWQRKKALFWAVLLLFLATTSAQMAPGDENERCTEQLIPEAENVMMLMNSRNYLQLLEEVGAVWDQRDFDDNNPTTSFTPTYFKHNAGGLCRWSVMSCGFREGSQNNWLFTQFINKAVPTGTNYNVNITIELLYTLSSCRARYNCNPEISIYKFDTSGPQHRDVYTDPSNYRLVKKKPGASALTQLLVMTVEIPPEVEGFYLAIQDNTSCIQVAQLKVYRNQCASKQEGLVMFPETAAPVSNSTTVTAGCMPNASPMTTMDMTCDSTGIWSGSGECVCDAGYIKKQNPNDFCEACPPGEYRSSSDPETACLPCPANTVVDDEAVGMCQCLTGYFRNTEGLSDYCPTSQTLEDASFGCTQPPSEPRNLQEDSSTASSLSVSWSAPAYLGGRSDLYYTVEYSDPDNVGVMLLADCSTACLTNTQCTIMNLQSATAYVVRVTAHNGVSDQDRGGALARQTETVLQTSVAPPPVPTDFTVFSGVVVWLMNPNVPVNRYEIVISGSGFSNILIEVPAHMTFYVLTQDQLSILQGGAEIKVRAVNDAGPGAYTPPKTLIFTGSCPRPTPSPVITPPVTTPIVTIPGAVTDIILMGDCSLAWRPPADMGGERPGYIVRFYTGTQFVLSSPSSEKFDYSDDPERNYARYDADCPTDQPLYAQVRAVNSAGKSPFSQSVEVNPDRDEITPCPTQTVTTTVTQPPETVTDTSTVTTTATVTDTETVSVTDTVTNTQTETVFVTTTATETATVTSTTTTTQTTTVSTPCPTPPPTPPVVTDPVTVPSVALNLTVLCDCVITWRPPADMGGERPGYIVKFYEGTKYGVSPVATREYHDFIADPERSYAVYGGECPTDRPFYADIRAVNSAGKGELSERIEVNPGRGSTQCPECDSCCPQCPACPLPVAVWPASTVYNVTESVNMTADVVIMRSGDLSGTTTITVTPIPDTADAGSDFTSTPIMVTFSAGEKKATARVPILDDSITEDTEMFTLTLTSSQSQVVISDSVITVTILDNDVAVPTCSDPSAIPGSVTAVRVPECGRLEWDPVSILQGCEVGLVYKIRVFSGFSFETTSSSQRRTLESDTNSLTFTAADLPSGRPIRATVRAKTETGVNSDSWSPAVTATDALTC